MNDQRQIRGPFPERFFHRSSNSTEKSFCSHPSCSQMIATKSCTWHDSCAVMTCAKFDSDKIHFNGVTLKPVFHWIWMMLENRSWNGPILWTHKRHAIAHHWCEIWAVFLCKYFEGNYPFNSLAPGRFQINFRKVIFKLTSVNDGWGISYEISLRWMPLDLIDDKSTLVQVMAWCRQATSHYLNQCWPRSPTPYGVTRPQRVN